MSIRVMTTVWDARVFEGGTLLVLLALADWANDDGTKIYPTLKQIGEKAMLSERGTRECMRRLESSGVLALVSAADGTPGRANEWRIDLPRLQELSAQVKASKSEKTDGGRNCPPAHEQAANGRNGAEREIVPDAQTDRDVVAAGGGDGGTAQPIRGQFAAAPQTGADGDTNGGSLQHERGHFATIRGQFAAPPLTPSIEQPSLQPPSQPSSHPPSARAGEPAPVRNQKSAKVYPGEFETLLAALPPCAGASKAKALKAWEACVAERPEIGLLVDAARAYAAALDAENAKRPKTDQRSPCSPATWIEERRWESFVPAGQPQQDTAQAKEPTPGWACHPAEAVLRKVLGPALFDTWLAPCWLDILDEAALLHAPTRLIRDMLANRYLDEIERAFAPLAVVLSLDGDRVEIKPSSPPPSIPASMPSPKPSTVSAPIDDLTPPSFLIRAPENREAA